MLLIFLSFGNPFERLLSSYTSHSDLMSFTVTPLPFLHSLPAGGRSREPALRYGMRDEGPTEAGS